MADQIARGEELEKKAEKQLSGWGLFCSKYDDAADLFDRAANAFKLGESCKSVHILESKHEAANAYADAAHCYKKTNTRGSGLFVAESISFLEQSVNLFLEIVRLNLSAGITRKLGAGY